MRLRAIPSRAVVGALLGGLVLLGASTAIAKPRSVLILPFAPWQRSTGTPGLTIDRLLSDRKLGSERPYTFR